jgi:hypothetical protein
MEAGVSPHVEAPDFVGTCRLFFGSYYDWKAISLPSQNAYRTSCLSL